MFPSFLFQLLSIVLLHFTQVRQAADPKVNISLSTYRQGIQNADTAAAEVVLQHYGNGNGHCNGSSGKWKKITVFDVDTDRNSRAATSYTLTDLLEALPRLEESLPTKSSNQQCAKHSSFILQKANTFELWPLKILDSSGKLSAGLLKGNINQLGDFDQCLSSSGLYYNESTGRWGDRIRGKYCLAAVDFTLPPTLQHIDHLIHSHHIIRSKLTDPYHRIPKFSSMYWAVCVPHSCSADDVQRMIGSQMQKLNIPGLTKQVSVKEHNCYTVESQPIRMSSGTIFAVLFFMLVIGFTSLATVLDYFNCLKCSAEEMKMYDVLLQSFSLKRNVNALLNLDGPPDDVECLHGIRAVNAVALLISHKCMQLLFYPYVNRTPMTELISYPWSMLGRSAILYTDSFVLISGCLAAQCFLKLFDKKRGGHIFSNYISRFLRLTPSLAAIILFCTFILPLLGSGPLWNNVITKHADLCQKYWWRNLLYVHNYFGFEEMCLTHTHQLGIDMQLYILSPALIYLLWKSPSVGVLLSIIISAFSTYLRYSVTFRNNLSPILYFGVSVSQLFNTASLSYILPTHRATAYIMGILLGYYLRYRSTTPIKMTYAQVRIGSFLAIIAGSLAMFGPYWMADRNYKYNAKEMAIYMALSPIAWCSAIMWGIFINVNSYMGVIGELFKWRRHRVFTRIAYALYLVQFPVYFYNVGTTRAPKYFTSQILLNIEEYAIIFGLSILLTLLFDLPFQNITKLVKLNSSAMAQLNYRKQEKAKAK